MVSCYSNMVTPLILMYLAVDIVVKTFSCLDSVSHGNCTAFWQYFLGHLIFFFFLCGLHVLIYTEPQAITEIWNRVDKCYLEASELSQHLNRQLCSTLSITHTLHIVYPIQVKCICLWKHKWTYTYMACLLCPFSFA